MRETPSRSPEPSAEEDTKEDTCKGDKAREKRQKEGSRTEEDFREDAQKGKIPEWGILPGRRPIKGQGTRKLLAFFE